MFGEKRASPAGGGKPPRDPVHRERKGLESAIDPAILRLMPVDLPLREMSFPDKLQLLETLWDELSRSPDELPSPEWHKDVLDERRRRVQAGEETFSDWESAKQDIRRRIS